MASLSLAMIVRNEEQTLPRILEAARQFCDELVVVDTGSTDRTRDIAREAGAIVYEFPWIDDFAAARNFSFSKCTCDWIIWLDADDIVSPASIEVAKKLKADVFDNAQVDSLTCPYNYVIGSDGVPITTQGRERFVRRSVGMQWVGRVHETICAAETLWASCPDFIVDHHPTDDQQTRKKNRNIDIFEQYLDLDTCTCHELFLYAGELVVHERLAEAATVFYKYLDRYPKGKRDVFDEKYLAYLKLCEVERLLLHADEALAAAGNAIAYDCSRAEAYGLLGTIHKQLGNWEMAIVAFKACAAGIKPTRMGLVVFDTFYDSRVQNEIAFCQDALAEQRQQELANAVQVGRFTAAKGHPNGLATA